jgi:Zn-finger nucleic acid-binding protein
MIPVCPKCDVGLFILNFKDVEVDFCEKCRGIWLDAGELEALMSQTGASPNDPLLQMLNETAVRAPDKKYLCPRCDEAMGEICLERAGKSLVLERCPRGHGWWFDAGELRRLLAMFPPESGAANTVAFLNDMLGAAVKT